MRGAASHCQVNTVAAHTKIHTMDSIEVQQGFCVCHFLIMHMGNNLKNKIIIKHLTLM